MKSCKAVVVSDLHIGLPFFRKAAFMQFIESLDDRTTVILNGDIVDNPHQRLEPQDQAVLDFLVGTVLSTPCHLDIRQP